MGTDADALTDGPDVWTTCADIVREQVSDSVWFGTFQQVSAVLQPTGEVLLIVPSTFVKERIESRYLELVRAALLEGGVPAATMLITVDESAPDPLAFDDNGMEAVIDLTEEEPTVTLRSAPVGEEAIKAPPMAVDPTIDFADDRYTFEAFVPGASNRFAHAAALSVAEKPGRSYNPLFIYGAAGLGKTHLLHAIGDYVRRNYPTHQVRYVSTETFLNEFVESIRNSQPSEFKSRYRGIDVLLVDDIQFMEGKERMQEEFFHTFNSLHQANKQIVLCSDRPPDSISTLEDRLRSRFKMGLITDIQPPDLETRLAILRKKAEQEPVWIPDEVLDFIASHVKDNIRELEGALIRVSAFANLTRVDLTVDLASEVLGDTLRENEPRPITADLILDVTTEEFDFSFDELVGRSRRRPLVNARQIAMYVIREMTDLSYPAIASEFGGRDHTTVIHAVDKIAKQMGERRQTYDQVTALRAAVQRKQTAE